MAIKRKPKIQPTRTGRRLLALIAEQRAVAGVSWDDHRGYERVYHRTGREIVRIGRAMMKRRVTCLSAVIDRAILSGWWSTAELGGGWYIDGDFRRFHASHIEATLQLAGLTIKDVHAEAVA